MAACTAAIISLEARLALCCGRLRQLLAEPVQIATGHEMIAGRAAGPARAPRAIEGDTGGHLPQVVDHRQIRAR
jgi:hypothetical protein